MKKPSISLLVAGLLALMAAQPALAQEAPEEPAAEEAVDAESSEADASEVAEQSDEEEAERSDEEADEADEERASADEAEEEAEADAEAEAEAAESGEPTMGPGGKPLRDDYPGTPESKKARMDTDRIEGLTFDEDDGAEEVHDLRIRELETKVDDLKETVFRSKSRIVLLKETVLSGSIAGSRAIVNHVNELGGSYQLRRALYSMDGSRIFNEQDEKGGLSGRSKIEVYKGSISPGTHRLSVMMDLQGSGYGMFSYMDGYNFSVQDSCEFTAQEGRNALIQVRLYEKGGAFSRYEDRLGIDCSVNMVDLSRGEWGEDEAAEGEESAEPAARAAEAESAAVEDAP